MGFALHPWANRQCIKMAQNMDIPYRIEEMRAMHVAEVLEVQRMAFTPELRESTEVFDDRIARFGRFSRVALLDGRVVAYLLSFPWKLGDTPVNNQKFPENLPAPDCFYIHDIALLPNVRGSGLARMLVDTAFSAARAQGFTQVSLVAVAQSGDYWDRAGFTPYAFVTPQKAQRITEIYGEGARLMVRGTSAVNEA